MRALTGEAPRASTIHGFTRGLLARCVPDLSPAGVFAPRLLVADALAKIGSDRLPMPEEPASRVALARAVDLAIGRLRRSGTSASHLAATATKTGHLLADILTEVDATLAKRSLYDDRAAPGLLAEHLGREGIATPERAIRIGGILSLEPAEAAELEALHTMLRRAGGSGVVLELPRLEGPLATAAEDAIAPIADELERRWASLEDPPEIAWRELGGGEPSAVIVARDLDGEARAIAARVLHAIEGGTSPERVAIVVPDLDEARLAPLRAWLTDAGVPFGEPRGRPAASCPEGRIILTVLAMADGAITRDGITELLRAPGIDAASWMDRPARGEAHRRAVALAHRLRDVPVENDRTGRLILDALTDVTRDRPDEAWMPRALDRLLRDVRWTASADPTAPGGDGATRSEIARRLVGLLDRVSLGRPSQGDIRSLLLDSSTAALGRAAIRDSSAAVQAVREGIRALVGAASATGLERAAVTAPQFAAELGHALDEIGIGVGVREPGAVRITRPEGIAGLSHDLVIVSGLASGSYAGNAQGYAFLDERTRRALPSSSRPASARQREVRCRAELVWSIGGATSVILTHTASEGALGAVHDLVRWARGVGAAAHEEPASRLARSASRTGPRSEELIAIANGASPSRDVAERAAAERARMAFFMDPRRPSTSHTGRVELGDPKKLVAAVGGHEPTTPIAVTAIERAAGCAFVGFARRVLRIRRAEELVEIADARDRGTLVHRALHAAFEGARDASPDRAGQAARVAAERALGLGGALTPLRREVIEVAIDDAVAVVEAALDPSEGFRFVTAEQRFGPAFVKRGERSHASAGSAWDALALAGAAANDPVVYVDGQIDRVDLSRDGRTIRVVDYKTGRPPSAAEHGKRVFQLPLYARAAARSLDREEVEAVYVSVRARGVIQEWPRSEEDRRALGASRDEVITAARRVVLGLWSGEAGPRPATATLCARCDVRDVCRRPAVAPVEEADH